MDWKIKPFTILLIIVCLCMGFILGMVVQQQAMIKAGYEFARGLEGTNFEINVDINETIMVDKMIDFFNETIRLNEAQEVMGR